VPNRRAFLKSAAAAATPAGLRFRVHAQDKPGTRPVVIGAGAHKYECLHHWGKLPARMHWQTTHGVAIDNSGLVYITHQGTGSDVMDTVVVFDAEGTFVRSFGREYFGGGHGIDLRREGTEEFLYLSDFAHGLVCKTTLRGELVWRQMLPREPMVYKQGMAYKPTNVAFGPDGDYYIADGYGSHFIHHYDRSNKWLRTFGGKGDQPGQCQTPHGLWLDNRPGREPALVVADRANFRLQYFSLDGQHLGFVKDVLFPAHFDIRGDVLLVPDLHGRVSLFGKNNQVIAHLGDDPEWIAEVKKLKVRNDPSAWPAGRFVHPHDACFDARGNIFVAEWVQPGRITKLRRVS
jgi:hypothetical protein